MTLCIPTQTGEGKDAQVYGHFGSAPFFTIYNTETGAVQVIDNANQHHEHGMCNPLRALEGKQVDAVVTGGMGARAVQMLNAAGVKVFRAVPGTVAELAKQFAGNGLEELTVENSCGHHHGCH